MPSPQRSEKPHDEHVARKSEETAVPSPQRSEKPHDEHVARKSEETAEPSPQRSKKNRAVLSDGSENRADRI